MQQRGKKIFRQLRRCLVGIVWGMCSGSTSQNTPGWVGPCHRWKERGLRARAWGRMLETTSARKPVRRRSGGRIRRRSWMALWRTGRISLRSEMKEILLIQINMYKKIKYGKKMTICMWHNLISHMCHIIHHTFVAL